MPTLTVLCADVEVAQRIFAALEAAGVPPARVSVLARGVDVDRKLVASYERANPRAGSACALTPLARKLSGEKRFLLEGCWAVGPLFEKTAERTGEQGKAQLARALLRAGLGLREEAEIEAALKGRGGVWLAVEEDEARLEALEKELRGTEAVKVSRFLLS
jgi:hypothetical protein